jgi:predicted phage-related endonuclease
MPVEVLMLTAEQHRQREGKVTASFLPKLMAGDEEAIYREWQRLVEHPDYAPEDLSDVWPVQFGSHIEEFALDWHERKTARALSRRREVVVHPELPHVSCTLDAYRIDDACVIDCKAPGRWTKLEKILSYYPAQLVVQRACVTGMRAALLVVHGGDEPAEHPIEWDDAFEGAVWERVAWFWECVDGLIPPVAVKAVAAPVAAVRVVDMAISNAWAEHAGTWLANRDAAKAFSAAEKEIKALIEPDVSKAFGHGITASRAKNGAVTIREKTQ